jgi:hypothetical protein
MRKFGFIDLSVSLLVPGVALVLARRQRPKVRRAFAIPLFQSSAVAAQIVFTILLVVSTIVPREASAQCTGWPVKCTGIHPTTGKSSGGSSAGHGHGLGNIGTGIAIGTAVLGVIQSNRDASQQNPSGTQQVNRPTRKSSAPPVPAVNENGSTPGDDVTLSEVILWGLEAPMAIMVDKIVELTAPDDGPDFTLPPLVQDNSERLDPTLEMVKMALMVAMAKAQQDKSIRQFRSQMNQTHEP